MPKEVSKGACQEIVLTGDDVDLDALPIMRCWPRRPGAVHHPAGGDHARPEHRRPQRRHVPDAEDRPPLDVHALADPQGRACRSARLAGRDGSRSRWRSGSTRSRPTRRARRCRSTSASSWSPASSRARRSSSSSARRSTSRCRPTRRSCSRARSSRDDVGLEGPFGDHTGYYTPAEEFPVFRITRDHDAARRDLPVDRRRRAARRGRVAREGDRADLPAGDPDERARDRRLRPADRRRVPQLRDRLDPQALPGPRAGR